MDKTLRLIRADSLSAGTAQTGGMIRTAAISGDLVGAQSLWMGRTVVRPGTSSGDHHHGESETGIYVVSGHPVFVFRDPESNSLVRLETSPGDYVWVPPHVPHREENPSPDTEAVVVIARSTQEAIVVSVPSLLAQRCSRRRCRVRWAATNRASGPTPSTKLELRRCRNLQGGVEVNDPGRRAGPARRRGPRLPGGWPRRACRAPRRRDCQPCGIRCQAAV